MLELLKGHETAVISGTFTLIGVLLALAAGFINKWIGKRHDLNLKKLDFAMNLEKQQLFDPVISFLDLDLATMREIYSLESMDENQRGEVKINLSHLHQLPAIQARVRGLGDEELSSKFSEFSHSRKKISQALDSLEKDSFTELQKGIDLAGEIMNKLFERMNAIKN